MDGAPCGEEVAPAARASFGNILGNRAPSSHSKALQARFARLLFWTMTKRKNPRTLRQHWELSRSFVHSRRLIFTALGQTEGSIIFRSLGGPKHRLTEAGLAMFTPCLFRRSSSVPGRVVTFFFDLVLALDTQLRSLQILQASTTDRGCPATIHDFGQ